ncbi:hypothetical protein [Legionella quateirensis]|nr:hypothetical protein [Legionella quateirensis]
MKDGVTPHNNVIPNAMKDLLNVALCLHWEFLHCVQDDDTLEI